MNKKFIFTVVVIILIGIGYGITKQSKSSAEGSEEELPTDTAELRDLESVVAATGEVLPKLSSAVKSEISGRIVEIYVDEGDSVERGQLLLELDRTSFVARVSEAERSLEAEQLRLDRAERNFARQKELFEKEFVGEKAFLDAKTDYDLARLNLEIAQARLEDALDELSKTKISAPHEGIVTKLDVIEGQVISGATSVSNGTELMTVAQLKQLFMEAKINEVDAEKLHVGQVARIRFDAIQDYELIGEIGEIALSARRDGNIRVFPIEVFFEAADERVRPGISARVEIPVASIESAVSVLLSGVFLDDDGKSSFAYVKDGESWERREIEVGINDLQHVAVLSGVNEGDEVSLSRPAEFRDESDD